VVTVGTARVPLGVTHGVELGVTVHETAPAVIVQLALLADVVSVKLESSSTGAPPVKAESKISPREIDWDPTEGMIKNALLIIFVGAATDVA
jgi:hypothetical protein